MKIDRRVVNNRVFLLGLDELYREAMKKHERSELLRCAQETARTLSVSPADVPIEGYYTEDANLTEYFRLVRALQKVPKIRATELKTVSGFIRLKQVTESPIFGPTLHGEYLLSAGEDALSVALKEAFPDWTVESLTQKAYECAVRSNDFSLVALAALAKDSVVLAALRESVVLYAAAVGGAAMIDKPEYVWEVDAVVQTRATRFVETFNELFQESLPRPVPDNAEEFWMACNEWKIIGRCVRIGYVPPVAPERHYHWAIDQDGSYTPVVRDFWDTSLWTTQRYRDEQRSKERQSWKNR